MDWVPFEEEWDCEEQSMTWNEIQSLYGDYLEGLRWI